MSATAIRVQLGSSGGCDAWLDEAGNLVVPAAALPSHLAPTVSLAVGPEPRPSRGSELTLRATAAIAVAMLCLVGSLAIMAAHGRQWSWTGFAGSTSLWNWLHLFAQPIALVFMTVSLLSSTPTRRRRTCARVAMLLLTLLIVTGYGARWGWTGFPGKQLWDWLTLMLFPAVAVLLPEWVRRGANFGARARLLTALAAGGFVVLVIGGYRWGWTWTGFTGNTFRDWLDLMIAPLLLPVALKVVHTLHVARPVADLSLTVKRPAVRLPLPRWDGIRQPGREI
jgi:hypothetical protein